VKLQRQVERNIYLWTKADLLGLCNSMDTVSNYKANTKPILMHQMRDAHFDYLSLSSDAHAEKVENPREKM
jgi:hypothetical protein